MFQYCLETVMATTRNSFDQCLAAILRESNGYASNSPAGPANYGITQATYSAWRSENLLLDKDVRRISFKEVEAIYQMSFWIPSHAAECPPPLDLLMFKCAIESGPSRAIRILQRSLGIDDDGVFCPHTRDVARSCHGYGVALRFLDIWTDFYEEQMERHPDRRQSLRAHLAQLDRLRPTLQYIEEAIQVYA